MSSSSATAPVVDLVSDNAPSVIDLEGMSEVESMEWDVVTGVRDRLDAQDLQGTEALIDTEVVGDLTVDKESLNKQLLELQQQMKRLEVGAAEDQKDEGDGQAPLALNPDPESQTVQAEDVPMGAPYVEDGEESDDEDATAATKVAFEQQMADPNKTVAAMKQPDGLFRLLGMPFAFPHVSMQAASMARNIKLKELLEVFCQFLDKKLTRGAVERVIESYALAKRQMEHEKMLTIQFSKYGGGIGSGLQTMKAGKEATNLMCSKCHHDWVGKNKCFMCGNMAEPVLKKSAGAEITVDEVCWDMVVENGKVAWKPRGAQSEGGSSSSAGAFGPEEKLRASVDLGDFAQTPPPAKGETCFADQVPIGLRVSLRQEVVNRPLDEEAFKMKADRPQRTEDRQAGQEFLVFHPKCSKAAKISAKVNDNADVKRVVTEKEVEATIDHNLEVIHELQTGALSVGDEETQGAAVLRQLDLEKLRSAL